MTLSSSQGFLPGCPCWVHNDVAGAVKCTLDGAGANAAQIS